jgi:isopenicillin-N epimerase
LAPQSADYARLWPLDTEIDFLNHGSFGACPHEVLDAQRAWQSLIEREPVLFLHRELERHLDGARDTLARFIGADSEDIAFVPNTTTGVNTVLRSLDFAPGDEILTTDQEYNATRNAIDFVAGRTGARVVIAQIPFPVESSAQIVESVLARVSPRTRLLVMDHISSPTGLVLPIEPIIAALAERGVDSLIDGAHGPGQLPLDLRALGATYYTGNCHKWMCTPKGSALLWVRRDRQARIRPLSISHGASSRRTDRSRFRLEFDFQGTFDPSPFLVLPEAIEFLQKLLPGGWEELRRRNRELVLYGRAQLLRSLASAAPCPESMVGSLAAVVLPDALSPAEPPLGIDSLQRRLFDKHRIEVPVPIWPAPPKRLLRISAQVYNRRVQYDRLARVLAEELSSAPVR